MSRKFLYILMGLAFSFLIGCASSSMLKTSGYYDCNGGKCYFLNGVFYQVNKGLPDVDTASFEVLTNKPPGYARDKRKVYMGALIIDRADASTIQLISDEYVKDAFKVYYKGEEVVGASPDGFELINSKSLFQSTQWSRDYNSAYFRAKKVQLCDYKTFTHLSDGWGKDSSCVYGNYDKKLEGIDPLSFEVVNSMCGKDKSGYWLFFLEKLSKVDKSECEKY